jgi:hypothetical protein
MVGEKLSHRWTYRAAYGDVAPTGGVRQENEKPNHTELRVDPRATTHAVANAVHPQSSGNWSMNIRITNSETHRGTDTTKPLQVSAFAHEEF